MLDKPEKTFELMAAMKAAVPFEVELTPQLQARLRSDPEGPDLAARQIVLEVTYAGDQGGILCHVELTGSEKRLVVSLTHLQIRRTLPFSADALDYQKHRVKKLKKQRPSF